MSRPAATSMRRTRARVRRNNRRHSWDGPGCPGRSRSPVRPGAPIVDGCAAWPIPSTVSYAFDCLDPPGADGLGERAVVMVVLVGVAFGEVGDGGIEPITVAEVGRDRDWVSRSGVCAREGPPAQACVDLEPGCTAVPVIAVWLISRSVGWRAGVGGLPVCPAVPLMSPVGPWRRGSVRPVWVARSRR